MKHIFCLIIFSFIVQNIHPQSSVASNRLNSLVNEYDEIFTYSKLVVNSLTTQSDAGNDLLYKIAADPNIGTTPEVTQTNNLAFNSSFDLGLKWVSDATYNFRPGIGENEDVFFRSRVATGLDWVLLGEGSMQQKREIKRIYQQQLFKDSIQTKLNNNSLQLHYKNLFIQHVFDLHRLEILKKYQQIMQMQSAYQDKMFQAGLITEAVKVNAHNQLQTVTDMVSVYQQYLLQNVPDHLVQQYYNIPYTDVALPDWSSVTVDRLLTEEQMLIEMQNEYLAGRQKPSEKPSLRAKFRYNYYDNEQQNGRSFASIGASLTVPIRFGKDNQQILYQIHTNENNLYYEKLKLKDKLGVQHKSFYLLKNKLFQLQNEVVYVETLLKNENEVYNNHNKNFSPSKYITFVEMLIQKRLAVLEVKQQLCEAYINFQQLSRLNGISSSTNFFTSRTPEHL